MNTKNPKTTTANITSQGRVTMPKWVRDRLAIGPGSELTFDLTPSGDVVLRAGAPKGETCSIFDRIRGCATIKMRTSEILALTRGS